VVPFPRRSRTPRRARSRRRLPSGRARAAEVLEDRTLLSAVLVTNTNDGGDGSLRAAIEFANGNPGPDNISFSIPTTDPGFVDVDSSLAGGDADHDVFVIQLLSALPALTDDGTTIDGRTQTTFSSDTNPFGPEIVLDGSLAGTVNGLTLTSNGNSMFGLNIWGFDNGVRIDGANNLVAGSFVGTDPTGTVAAPNGGNGVAVTGSGNIIGTNGDGVDDAAERNVISGNIGNGILIFGIGADDNVVAGNYIGTNAEGTAALGNNVRGVNINSQAKHNLVGTNGDGVADAAERNVISGNGDAGIVIEYFGTEYNVVAGNYLGTNAAGTAAIGSHGNLVLQFDTQYNRIGTDGNGIADEAEGNVMAGSTTYAQMWIQSGQTAYNVVAGNRIGTNAAGTAPLSNTVIGLSIHNGARDNIIGTNGDGVADDVEGNLISGNARAGIVVNGSNTINNSLRGNSIYGNGGLGIDLGDDGLTANDSAVPFAGAGTALNFDGGTDYASVPDNAALDSIEQTDVVTVEAWGNIHGWDYGWFSIFDKYEESTDNGWQLAIEKNSGIAFTTSPGQGIVSGFVPVLNQWTHIALTYERAPGRVHIYVNGQQVFETAFGGDILDTSGEPLYLSFNPSGLDEYDNGSIDELRFWNVARSQAQIQADMNHPLTGSEPGLVGYWDFNEGSGVTFHDKTANHNDGTLADGSSRPTWVVSGAGLSNDSDVGPNRQQNFPTLLAATLGANTHVTGDLNSTPDAAFTLDFYSSPAADPSGYGEGRRYLGSATVMTDAAGFAHFDVLLDAATVAGEVVTATATDSDWNTSEFSAAVVADPDISGDYRYNGKGTHVVQQPDNSLTFVNEFGSESAGAFTSLTQVVASDWGGLAGHLVGNRIEWENATAWAAGLPDISGDFSFHGATRVEQSIGSLRFTNEHGGVSNGLFLNSTQVVATDWGGLTGNIVANRIEWANGSHWTAGVPDIAGDYTFHGATRVEQSINTLRFVNEHGIVSSGVFVTPSRVEAADWGGLLGNIVGNRIEWDNGTSWIAGVPDISGDYVFNGATRVEQSINTLSFINEHGNRSDGRFLSPTQVVAVGWGDLVGTISGSDIVWDNGTVWSRAGMSALTRNANRDALFAAHDQWMSSV
jgi:Concanavalin A-like lectin/glucanases superfamily